MKRMIWFAVGTAAGVYAVTKLRQRARAFTPQGVFGAVDRVAVAVERFGDQVRAGMTEREAALRDALGLDPSAAAEPARRR